MDPPQPPQEATDIFSLSDQVLAEKFQFIEEIGFGNWGSVWLCRPKGDPISEVHESLRHAKVAVKLVHRSKTPTTAARVRSLWNEMKIVRLLKEEGHPSIIPFYSFIITPSYALVTMAYHPRLVPVEVPEHHAKGWFRSLASGVDFLHKHGVVHNDIKPANIMLSKQNVPVLVDFGFAEKYDIQSSKAFHSDLAYGTPEYLSPERARGLPHDTRKSDVWALGVTFFEILVGRTPFEHMEGEQFSTKEDLEKYWSRTMKGKWVGTWKMSKGLERLLKRMISPNADLRYTSCEAMADCYWTKEVQELPNHNKTSSAHVRSPSLADIISPWSSRGRSASREKRDRDLRFPSNHKKQSYFDSPPGLDEANLAKVKQELAPARAAQHKPSRSQSKLRVLKDHTQAQAPPKGRAPLTSVLSTLSPIKGSPPTTPATKAHYSALTKENNMVKKENVVRIIVPTASVSRRPGGPRAPLSPTRYGVSSELHVSASAAGVREEKSMKDKNLQQRTGRVLADMTGSNQNAENVIGKKKEAPQDVDKVKQRVREWERERERLREMERLMDTELEDDGARTESENPKDMTKERVRFEGIGQEGKENENQAVLPQSRGLSELRYRMLSSELDHIYGERLPSSGDDSGLSFLRQNLKTSIDKTVRTCTSSVLGHLGRMSVPTLTLSGEAGDESELSSGRESWEEALIRDANCTLPAVHDAVRNARVGADSEADRMTIWMRNVEKVVEDARQNFASAQVLPPLPLGPATRPASRDRSSRSVRLPRRVLAASQIFASDPLHGSADETWTSAQTSRHSSPVKNIANQTVTTIPSEEVSVAPHSSRELDTSSPARARRATVGTRSPALPERKPELEIDTASPSRRREKSRSHNDLLRPISPIAKLEFELERHHMPTPPVRLSALLDSSLFVANPCATKRMEQDVPETMLAGEKSAEQDSLTSSPLHVEPYPARKSSMAAGPIISSPARRHIEGVYDRFLMATSGVKRVGRGYQSDNNKPVCNIPDRDLPKRDPSLFLSSRRPMPPPVSSEDLRKATSADELGFISRIVPGQTPTDDENLNTVRFMGRAIKAIVTGRTASRHASKLP